jgi:negative regulator of sigma E activity
MTDDMLITVVGDVPAITVKFIADAVKIASP